MNHCDAIIHLAQNEGRKLKISNTNVNTKLPFFEIKENKVVKMSNYECHDNATRLPFFSNYLNNNVLSNISKGLKVDGLYNIELHDSNSYLNNTFDYTNTLVWSRHKSDRQTILLPDLYQMLNYNGDLEIRDTYKFDTKPKQKIGFFGTTTGERDPSKNDRIQTCIWSLDKRDIIDSYITHVAQMSIDTFKETPRHDEIVCPRVTLNDMFQYKYLLDIPGNTYSWNRVPIILNSNSLLFKMNCSDNGWYFPLLHEGVHYVNVNTENMINKFTYYQNNPKEAEFIIQNANKFVTQFLKPVHAQLYLLALFEECSYWNYK